ncbi:MAG: hypothetical protein OEM48_11685 [Gammaproteobacteria bacterium]|nr:hypothetical protein [Gammaproteobacteria bacterium]MDH3407566.1 hypothetical protein [Gammaproteobacteria bacterium]
MKINKLLIVAVVFAIGISANADAKCRRVQVCDDYGMNCRAQDLCNSTLDLPSVDIDPLTPLPSTDLKPLPSIDLPPLRTSKCEYKQVNGQWQNVCW